MPRKSLSLNFEITPLMLYSYENGPAISDLPLFLRWCDSLAIFPSRPFEESNEEEIKRKARLALEMYQAVREKEKKRTEGDQMDLF